MRFINIDLAFVFEHKLTLQQAALFFYIKESSWAQEVILTDAQNQPIVYRWISRTKIVKDLSLITDKEDTVYRWLKLFDELGLISYVKNNGKDLVRLTAKGNAWNSFENSDSNPDFNNNRMTVRTNSDDRPNKEGLNSDDRPTYSNNNTYRDNKDSTYNSDLEKHQFETFRKSYSGTKRGLDTEFQNFKKHRDWKVVLQTLMESYNNQQSARSKAKENGQFVPQMPNLQTYINQRRWEEEFVVEAKEQPKINQMPKVQSNKTMAGKIIVRQ